MSEDYFLSTSFKDKLKKEYEKSKSLYEKLVDEVVYILSGAIEKNKIKIHSLASRETKIKTFESFYDKVVRKQVRDNQFETIEDIAGVRVICLYRSDLEKLGNIILENFDLTRADTSRTRTETPFGYSSDHYIVRLPKECKGARYDNIKNLKCEIQIRTILMDAWASVSHHLDYKQEVDIPKDLKTDFNSLAGLFYVADTHFELFKKGIEDTRTDLMKTVQQDIFNLDQEINLDSLVAFLTWRFPERKVKRVRSEIVSELKKFGYENIRQLDEKVYVALPALKEMEKEMFNQEDWTPEWMPDGLIRYCLDLSDDEYFKKRHPMVKRPSGDEVLKLIEKYRSKLR